MTLPDSPSYPSVLDPLNTPLDKKESLEYPMDSKFPNVLPVFPTHGHSEPQVTSFRQLSMFKQVISPFSCFGLRKGYAWFYPLLWDAQRNVDAFIIEFSLVLGLLIMPERLFLCAWDSFMSDRAVCNNIVYRQLRNGIHR